MNMHDLAWFRRQYILDGSATSDEVKHVEIDVDGGMIVATKDQITNQKPVSLSDSLTYTPGVTR